MLKRLITGLIIVAITAGFFALRFVSPYFFDLFVAVLAVGATYEVCGAFEKNNKKNDKFFIITYPLAILLTLIISIRFGVGEMLYFAIITCEALLYTLIMYIKNLATKKKINRQMLDSEYSGTFKNYVAKKSITNIFLLFYPAFLISLMFFVNHIAEFGIFGGDGNVLTGMLLLLMIFVTTIFTDTGAYLIGSGFRGKKLCPKISPNKTISGAIGGLLSGILGAFLVYFILNFIPSFAQIFADKGFGLLMFVCYGALASVMVQLGDIYASWIKRQNNIKDYGKIFPGHGGFMDRIDGMSFNLVLTTIFAFFMFL